MLKQKLGEEVRPRRKDADQRPGRAGRASTAATRCFVLGGIAARDGRSGLLAGSAERAAVHRRPGREGARQGACRQSARRRASTRRGGCWCCQRPAAVAVCRRCRAHRKPVVASGLEDPRHVAVDAQGNLSHHRPRPAHQVKSFRRRRQVRCGAIGKPGEPSVGPYDPLHLNHPNGVAIDTQGRVWVAEADNYHPQRVSRLVGDGELLRAFYGPAEYGGGGVLDPRDPTRFYYKGLEFKLDWQQGADQLVRVFSRPDRSAAGALRPVFAGHAPVSGGPRPGGSGISPAATRTIRLTATTSRSSGWMAKQHARLVAGLGFGPCMGRAATSRFRRHWPQARNRTRRTRGWSPGDFSWTRCERRRPAAAGRSAVRASVRSRGVTIMNDSGVRRSPSLSDQNDSRRRGFSACAAPRYDFTAPQMLAEGLDVRRRPAAIRRCSEPGGWTIIDQRAGAVFPYRPGRRVPRPAALELSQCLARPARQSRGRRARSAGHDRRAHATAGRLGSPAGDGGPMFCVNGNMGNMYLLTADGLFVATLFHDIRLRPNWADARRDPRHGCDRRFAARRELLAQHHPDRRRAASSWSTAAAPAWCASTGWTPSRRLPEQTLTVTIAGETLQQARDWFAEGRSRSGSGSVAAGLLRVALLETAPAVDGSSGRLACHDRLGPSSIAAAPRPISTATRDPMKSAPPSAWPTTQLFAALRTTEKRPAAQQRRNAQRAVQARRLPGPDAGHRSQRTPSGSRRSVPATSGCWSRVSRIRPAPCSIEPWCRAPKSPSPSAARGAALRSTSSKMSVRT